MQPNRRQTEMMLARCCAVVALSFPVSDMESTLGARRSFDPSHVLQDRGIRILRGVVRDTSGAAIAYVNITSGGTRRGLTNDSGGFELRVGARQRLRLEFRRLGSRVAEVPLNQAPTQLS